MFYKITYSSYQNFKYSYDLTVEAQSESEALEKFKKQRQIKKLPNHLKINSQIYQNNSPRICPDCAERVRKNGHHRCINNLLHDNSEIV